MAGGAGGGVMKAQRQDGRLVCARSFDDLTPEEFAAIESRVRHAAAFFENLVLRLEALAWPIGPLLDASRSARASGRGSTSGPPGAALVKRRSRVCWAGNRSSAPSSG